MRDRILGAIGIAMMAGTANAADPYDVVIKEYDYADYTIPLAEYARKYGANPGRDFDAFSFGGGIYGYDIKGDAYNPFEVNRFYGFRADLSHAVAKLIITNKANVPFTLKSITALVDVASPTASIIAADFSITGTVNGLPVGSAYQRINSKGYTVYDARLFSAGNPRTGVAGGPVFADRVVITFSGRSSVYLKSLVMDTAPFFSASAPPLPGGSGGFSVPEPAAWATMMLGFGLVGGAARRRKRVSGAA